MYGTPRFWIGQVVTVVFLATTTWPADQAAASFSLDYTLTGRIWVPGTIQPANGIAPVDREVALLGFGDCSTTKEPSVSTLQTRRRDCRFEQQVADALARAGIFRRVTTVDSADAATDLVLVPLGSRAEFQRVAIPAAKPFVYLSLFTYVWTPLPYERDTETYHFNIGVLDRNGSRRATVVRDRQYTHTLGTYSEDHTPSADLTAALKPHETASDPLTTCRGPHASEFVHELLTELSRTAQSVPSP